jgi:hypothetical protein
MTKPLESQPGEGTGHDRSTVGRSKSFLRSPLAIGAMTLGFLVGPGMVAGAVNDHLRESAKVSAQEIAEDSRDMVQSTLMKIHLWNIDRVNPKVRTVKPEYFGSVQLGDYVCGLGHSPYGYIINIGKRAFLVGQTKADLDAAIQKVKEALVAVQDQRSGIRNTLALAGERR